MVSCGRCSPPANCAIGPASECGHECSSRGYKWCARCAAQKKVCQMCGAALPAPPKKDGKRKRMAPR
ncbi:MAG: hypothetical protein RL272_557 [Candidatus Parcubacteria bacterium]